MLTPIERLKRRMELELDDHCRTGEMDGSAVRMTQDKSGIIWTWPAEIGDYTAYVFLLPPEDIGMYHEGEIAEDRHSVLVVDIVNGTMLYKSPADFFKSMIVPTGGNAKPVKY